MISYQGFTKQFGRVLAVHDLTLELRQGETLALIGPNGSGKTTTLKAALGLVRPSHGRVAVDGHDVATDGRTARARLGYLPQRIAFPDGCTARELLRFYARLRGAAPSHTERLLARTALDGAADRAVEGYSGGMRQRLGLAIALLGEPQALVLDEPTAALDPSGALLLRDILADIQREGITVLLSSHDLAEVAALAHRIGIFVAGRLALLGTTAELVRGLGVPGLEDTYRRTTTTRLIA
ncbi:MAG TPA: ABC transporter ATP-binding protein [Gemmatimonadaceae bacterium]